MLFGWINEDVGTLRIAIREGLPDADFPFVVELHLLDVYDGVVLVLVTDISEVAAVVLDGEASFAPLYNGSYCFSLTMREIVGTGVDDPSVSVVVDPEDGFLVVDAHLIDLDVVHNDIVDEVDVHSSVTAFPYIYDARSRQTGGLPAFAACPSTEGVAGDVDAVDAGLVYL